IEYNDTINNWGTPDTVIVTVVDNPPTSNHPADIVTAVGSTVTIPWILMDDYGAGYYRILVNSTPSSWASWNNNSVLNYPVDTSVMGIYNYTIQYNDSKGLFGVPDTVMIQVLEARHLVATSETQVNLTSILEGITVGDENGFSILVDEWNSTFIEALISNVSLHKYSFSIEEQYADGQAQVNQEIWVMAFNITQTCILDAVDFVYTTAYLTGVNVTGVVIYNATYNVLHAAIEPDTIIYAHNEAGLPIAPPILPRWVSQNAGAYWNGTLTVKPVLNVSNTYQNIFFIRFNATGVTFNWRYEDDGSNGDQAKVYEWDQGNWETRPADLTLRLTYTPMKSEMAPYEMNMMINTTPVTESGKWNQTGFHQPDTLGLIHFNVTSNWYNISYSVNWTIYLQNITRATTVVYAEPGNETVEWNVQILTMFIQGSFNNTINITIPFTWNATTVYKGITIYNDWEELTGNPKKSIIIRNASDDTWLLVCDGYNWITNITINKDPIYTLDIVNVTAHLLYPVQDQLETAQLNITNSLQTILDSLKGKGIGTEINFTWDISQAVYTNGNYQLIVSWCNGTEAGLWNITIVIYNTTSLEIAYPQHILNVIERSRGSPFNLILYYEMAFWDANWKTLYLENAMGASVTYKYMGQAPQAMTPTEWEGHPAWVTQLTAPDTTGDYPILINATAWSGVQNYTNYLIILRVAQYESKLIFNDTAKEAFWNTSIAFSFTYSNLTGYPIQADNVTIEWKYSSDSTYRGMLFEGLNYTLSYNGGTGVYTIIFGNFSAHTFNLHFYIDAESYQPQDTYLTIIFKNRTTSLINLEDIPRILYHESGIVNITLYFKDIIGNQGISGGVIQSNWSNIKSYLVQELGNGYYNISLDISGVQLGNYTVSIEANKENYELTILILNLEIYGYNTSISSLIAANLTGTFAIIYALENWSITFKYENVSNGVGITNAIISATFGGQTCAWQEGSGGNYTVWADSTKLQAPMAGQNYTLQIIIQKRYYKLENITITVYITKLPSKLYPIKSSIKAEVGEFVKIAVQLNDTYNQRGINGIVWYSLQGVMYQMVPGDSIGSFYAILNLTNYTPNTYNIQITAWAVDYQNSSTTITLEVMLVVYNLTIRVPSHSSGGEFLTIKAQLWNGTHFVSGVLINFTIILIKQGDIVETYYRSNYTATNGTAIIIFRVPLSTITIHISATYESAGGAIVYSDTEIVTAVDPWVFTLENIFILVVLLLISGYILIAGVYLYRRKLRPKLMSIEDKKRTLLQKRAENRREIMRITQEIKTLRSKTLKEADVAKNNMNFKKAAELYEKAGNLTLELADKSVAREFFLKAKEMQRLAEQKERQKELRERREKLLEKARVAIRERNVVEAARNYRQVAELSRMLGEKDQAEKFLKLANAAHERIEALKEGDLRKKSGQFLSKADKAMGKQNFIEAAENFEEAAKIMILLGEDDGLKRFAGWAKLARERDALANQKTREEWMQELKQKQKSLINKAKMLVREKNFEDAIQIYTTLA
ncbi:MAG: hypothetical protein ACTSYB_05050, partial [Candidatus Helarchaeota archaeon]